MARGRTRHLCSPTVMFQLTGAIDKGHVTIIIGEGGQWHTVEAAVESVYRSPNWCWANGRLVVADRRSVGRT